MIEITVNGAAQKLAAQANVQQLLETLGIGSGRIAVEVNGEIVPRSTFNTHTLQAGDKVEIVQAIGGG